MLMMKTIASGLLVLGLLTIQVSEAMPPLARPVPTGRDASVRAAQWAFIVATAMATMAALRS
jgi:hypothetical protein